jgi:hypothetical protein
MFCVLSILVFLITNKSNMGVIQNKSNMGVMQNKANMGVIQNNIKKYVALSLGSNQGPPILQTGALPTN